MQGMTFRQAAAEYHQWLRTQPEGRQNLAARRRRQEYNIEKYALPYVGEKSVADVAKGMEELEAAICASAGKRSGDLWVDGIIQSVWAVIQHCRN